MIYFVTVYWDSSYWIRHQLLHINRYTKLDYEVLSFIDEHTIPPDDIEISGKLITIDDMGIKSHAKKLTILGQIACIRAINEDDIIIFIDADAFPIKEYEEAIFDLLKKYPLVAIRRDDNAGDYQPHPSFCATTVKFWKKIKGDWSAGYKWRNSENYMVTDVGGNLLKQLTIGNYDWYPLLRSNLVNKHPLFFGIYGNIIYHHGAGSRNPSSRIDLYNLLKRSLLCRALYRIFNNYKALKLIRFFEKIVIANQSLKNRILSESVKNEIALGKDIASIFNPK